MVKVPQVTKKDLEKWYELSKKLTLLKVEESLLRKRVFAHYFPNPTEGTNTYDGLDKGFVLKGKHVINRTVDVATLTAMSPELREKGINPDDLIEYKPTLKKRAYNKLTEEQLHLFDQVLTIKPGSPSMDVVQPKK